MNKYFKRCSPSLATRKMQTKMTFRLHLIPLKMAKIKKTKKTHPGEDMGNKDPSRIVDRNENRCNHCGNHVPQKVKIDLPYNLATIPLLGTYPKDSISSLHVYNFSIHSS